MAVTILAALFLAIMVTIVAFGYKMVIRQHSNPQNVNLEQCSVCRKAFEKDRLVLRQIGDYKLLYFCRDCIIKLYSDLGLKN